MKYLLNDDVIMLKYLNGLNPTETMIFNSYYDIHTISDLLKYGKEVRRTRYLQIIVKEFEKNDIKFDDELKVDELHKRNEERKSIEMKVKNIREKVSLEEILPREVESLDLPREVINKLKQRQIYTIEELIDESSYIFFQEDTSVFKETHIKKIIDILSELGLHLNMKNQVEGIKEKDGFKVLEDKKVEQVKPGGKPFVQHEQTEPEIVFEKPRKRSADRDSWNNTFEYLKIFKSYFGHIFIPKAFKPGKVGIGEWIISQRKAYKGTKGTITSEQIEKLDSLEMSWVGITTNKLKQEYYQPLNIKDIKVINGVLYTYYLDDTVKTSNDKEFMNMIKEKAEVKIELPKGILDMMEKYESDDVLETYNEEEIRQLMDQTFEEPKVEKTVETKIEEEQLDRYALMQKRIEQMKSEKASMISENARKKQLIDEYNKLISELESLITDGLELDRTINDLLGIETEVEKPISLPYGSVSPERFEDARKSLSEEISKKQEENNRKQELIDEFKKAEEELTRAQNEEADLDIQIATLFNPSNTHVKKRGEL